MTDEMRAYREAQQAERKARRLAWYAAGIGRMMVGTGCVRLHDDGRVEAVSYKCAPRPAWCSTLRRTLFAFAVDNVSNLR